MRWLRKLRFPGRAHRAGKATPRPAEDWAPGDLAECIGPDGWYTEGDPRFPSSGPGLGQVCKVASVMPLRSRSRRGEVLCLAFAAWGDRFYAAEYFRKVIPRADEATRCEAGFLELLRQPPAPAHPEHCRRAAHPEHCRRAAHPEPAEGEPVEGEPAEGPPPERLS